MPRTRIVISSDLSFAPDRYATLVLTRATEPAELFDRKRFGRAGLASIATTGFFVRHGITIAWGSDQDEVLAVARANRSGGLLLVIPSRPKPDGKLQAYLALRQERGIPTEVVVVKKAGHLVALEVVPNGKVAEVTMGKASDPGAASRAPATPRKPAEEKATDAPSVGPVGGGRVAPAKQEGWRSSPNETERGAPSVNVPS